MYLHILIAGVMYHDSYPQGRPTRSHGRFALIIKATGAIRNQNCVAKNIVQASKQHLICLVSKMRLKVINPAPPPPVQIPLLNSGTMDGGTQLYFQWRLRCLYNPNSNIHFIPKWNWPQDLYFRFLLVNCKKSFWPQFWNNINCNFFYIFICAVIISPFYCNLYRFATSIIG